MIRLQSHRGPRRATIAPLTAVLLIPLLALAAFSVDLGYIVLVQSDLQNAADSAALAGANQMMSGYVQYNLPGQSANQASIISAAETGATASAKQYAGLNSAGGTSLTLLNSDVEYGYTDASGNYTALSSTSTTYPNTVKVTLRRDSSANTPLGLFFGPVLGKSTVDLKATAAATIYTANIDSVQNVANLQLGLLPYTYDVNNWNNFLTTGQGPDGGTMLTDSNGNPELQIYPSIKDTGNFGILSINGSHAGASTISGWISNGMSQSDLQNLQNVSSGDQTPLIPLSQHNQNITPSMSTDGLGSWNWVGDPGVKTSDVHTLSNYVGDVYLLPLFKPAVATSSGYQAGYGGGSHYYYNIVQFVSVKIAAVDGKNIYVQPVGQVVNYNFATFSGQAPAGASVTPAGTPSLITTFTAPKLTQ